MPSTVHKLLLKTKATMAAADTYDTAGALAERFAAFVSFRWQQPKLPLTQNVISAATPVFSPYNSAGIMRFMQKLPQLQQQLQHFPFIQHLESQTVIHNRY